MADENVNVEQQNETPKEIAVYKGDDIRDKKLVDAESATTAQSGDSVVLKTTAGTYVEIDRDSFAEVMREELGRLIKGTADKGTSINSVAAMDASNDLGWISPTNLASVLGVVEQPIYRVPISTNIDTEMPSLTYLMGSHPSKRGTYPTMAGGAATYVFVLCINAGNNNYNTGLQLLLVTPSGRRYQRIKNGNNWDGWVEF